MKHTRSLFVLLLCFLVLAPLSAAVHTSVPVDHRVYRILEVAQIRGLIENQLDVKPYSASKILSLLQTIASKPEKLSKSELQQIQQLIASFNASYGYEPSDIQSLLTTGYLRSYDA